MPRALLVSLRPWQWLKNALLLAPLVFARRLGHGADVRDASLALFAFCLISSAGYLWNDLCDREADRRHPAKATRPIPSGALPLRTAVLFSILLLVSGFFIAGLVGGPGRPRLLFLCGAYALLTGSYSLILKRLPYFDVITIAAGFLLRIYAGGAAIDVEVSRWLLACTFFGAVFVGLGKRIGEVLAVGADGGTRRALAGYSLRPLQLLNGLAGLLLVITYTAYTFAERTQAGFGGHQLALTVPFALIGVLRYARLIRLARGVEDPARLFLRDRWLVVTSLLWLAAVGLALLSAARAP